MRIQRSRYDNRNWGPTKKMIDPNDPRANKRPPKPAPGRPQPENKTEAAKPHSSG